MSERLIRPELAPRELPPLIETLAIAELLVIGETLIWSVPVIGDAPVLDNRLNAFAALDPTWPQGDVRLSHLLRNFANQGRSLYVETLDTNANRQFVDLLAFTLPDPAAVQITFVETLTTPGWISESWALLGRARWTEAGIHPEEALRLTREAAGIAEIRALFAERKETQVC